MVLSDKEQLIQLLLRIMQVRKKYHLLEQTYQGITTVR